MSNTAQPNQPEPPTPDVEVALKITLVPALSVKELGEFQRLAQAEGQSLPERLASLVRRDLTAA
jgi:hypothetical protein